MFERALQASSRYMGPLKAKYQYDIRYESFGLARSRRCLTCWIWPEVSGCTAGSAAAANGRAKASWEGSSLCTAGASAVAVASARGALDSALALRARRLAVLAAALRNAIFAGLVQPDVEIGLVCLCNDA